MPVGCVGRGEGGVRKWAASGLWKARSELNLFLFPALKIYIN